MYYAYTILAGITALFGIAAVFTSVNDELTDTRYKILEVLVGICVILTALLGVVNYG